MYSNDVIFHNVFFFYMQTTSEFFVLFLLLQQTFILRMNWSNNLSKKLRNSYNAMKRLLRGINI
jgi:hypothetical protein